MGVQKLYHACRADCNFSVNANAYGKHLWKMRASHLCSWYCSLSINIVVQPHILPYHMLDACEAPIDCISAQQHNSCVLIYFT
jgi:hypothetical protein